ncbi:hypothetical protein [Paenarthrobacter aurescens]|uniref:Alkaline shock response membrane anchor protein AmaP n=1 Tax=Paenarthrobacter aurescens TaxID=43663 RepID=A0A4Y3NK80_PAEAU|nr:hypothetical protein [Paenarthrobacter aurescens]MDO6145396.1 hypothetical protein [Paenarthrobacter aurescens]MDO6149201.1 hypothetical protein [Paenarthrobacter aurescens]MDO6160445.1 hypothetical protein [Paenarthrobacter aurescens]MDO6164304.1 hypothetical protein [Paenarthrobacter aurescens]GEB19576.1 hypothetical protein AAU01_23310 [Paenarthrobacter aurescens]
MRNTNRALNRMVLTLLGIVLLGAGAALIAAGSLPGAAEVWTSTASLVRDQARNLAGMAPLPDPVRSWWLVLGVAIPLVGAVLSAAWLASQGGGKTPRLAEQSEGPAGRTVIDSGLVSVAIREALSGNTDVLSSSVSAWESRRGTALRIRVEARKGASPRALADSVELLLQQLDRLLGHPMPVLVRITSGTRTQVSGSRRAR